jgi:hypothetical protein
VHADLAGAAGFVPPAFQVANMSGQIIRLSIPIATIAVSSAAVFGLSWIGLALLGF